MAIKILICLECRDATRKVHSRGLCHACWSDRSIRSRYEPLPNKYGANRCEVDGISFDSTKEARRYGELKILQSAGFIKELTRQVSYDLVVEGVHICTYRSDFEYLENGIKVVEDAKGMRTDIYLIKRRLMLALYGITIKET